KIRRPPPRKVPKTGSAVSTGPRQGETVPPFMSAPPPAPPAGGCGENPGLTKLFFSGMSYPPLIKGTISGHLMLYTSLPGSKCRRQVGESRPMVDPYANRRAEARNERTFEGVGQRLASVGAAGVAAGRAAGHVRRFLGDAVRDLAAMIRDLGHRERRMVRGPNRPVPK